MILYDLGIVDAVTNMKTVLCVSRCFGVWKDCLIVRVALALAAEKMTLYGSSI